MPFHSRFPIGATNIQMQAGISIFFEVDTQITASTTQTQVGATALTADISHVNTVANANDAVRLPTAVVGRIVRVFNDGANILQIFPASDDKFGDQAANLSVDLEENSEVEFVAITSSEWDSAGGTALIHGDMFFNRQSTERTIDTADIVHGVIDFAAGDLNNVTFVAGIVGSISAFANAGGGLVTVTDTGHGLVTNDIITIHGTTSYNGTFLITRVDDDNFTIVDTFVANDATGNWEMGDYLLVPANGEGTWQISLLFSATAATNNDIFTFTICVNTVRQTKFELENKYAVGADIKTVTGIGLIDLADNDRVWVGMTNLGGTGNITPKHGNMTIERI